MRLTPCRPMIQNLKGVGQAPGVVEVNVGEVIPTLIHKDGDLESTSLHPCLLPGTVEDKVLRSFVKQAAYLLKATILQLIHKIGLDRGVEAILLDLLHIVDTLPEVELHHAGVDVVEGGLL